MTQHHTPSMASRWALRLLTFVLGANCPGAEILDNRSGSLTPPPAAPRINGPTVFGVRPGSPLLYTIPIVGDRPLHLSVENLPQGLALDPSSGRIRGCLKRRGEYPVVFRAQNSLGADTKRFRIVVGETIALTPPMGWNSYNCWAGSVDQQKVLRAARAMVASGLINHGWTYINIDDSWQGRRAGKDHALQGNERFPDLKGLCSEIHNLGLKAGIYSTPWITSYGKYPGGSSDSTDGSWTSALAREAEQRHGRHSFASADARQWVAWGFDYLKYDWYPNDVPHAAEMSKALRRSGRDIVFSLSNTAAFDRAADWARWANSWRTTDDIRDRWSKCDQAWQCSVSEIGFCQDRWAAHAGPGHWNDPDMLVVGYVGWGPQLHASCLTPDEQYSHVSLWCLLSAPLLLGCDLERLDAFTVDLLSNDEVLALDQDALGEQAVRVATMGSVEVFLKKLEDRGKALGFFNRGSTEQTLAFGKLSQLGFTTRQRVRDLWRHQDLPDLVNPTEEPLKLTIPAHGVQLYKLTTSADHLANQRRSP